MGLLGVGGAIANKIKELNFINSLKINKYDIAKILESCY